MAKSRRHTQDCFQSAEIVRLVVIAGKGVAAFLLLSLYLYFCRCFYSLLSKPLRAFTLRYLSPITETTNRKTRSREETQGVQSLEQRSELRLRVAPTFDLKNYSPTSKALPLVDFRPISCRQSICRAGG